MSPVASGDVIVFPLLSTDDLQAKRITVKWSQNLSNHSEAYLAVKAVNKSKANEEVALFIQASAYNLNPDGGVSSSAGGNPSPIGSVGKVVDGKVELTIDNKYQFGQKNAAGEGRFLVYHNKDNKMYQHRFIETTFASLAANYAGQILGAIKIPQAEMANFATNLAKGIFGDYLKNF